MTVKKAAPRKKGPVKKAPVKAPVKSIKKSVKKPVAKKASAAKPRTSSRVTNPANVSSRVVDEIPKTRRGAAKSTRYRDTLAAIRADVGAGRPVIVAEFVSGGGAAQARRQLLKGNLICDGKVDDWTFTARRTAGEQGSILYAELN